MEKFEQNSSRPHEIVYVSYGARTINDRYSSEYSEVYEFSKSFAYNHNFMYLSIDMMLLLSNDMCTMDFSAHELLEIV